MKFSFIQVVLSSGIFHPLNIFTLSTWGENVTVLILKHVVYLARHNTLNVRSAAKTSLCIHV